MKARVRQLQVEMKSIKKGNNSITKYVFRVKAIANSLLVVGDSVSEQSKIDSILYGLPKEYNPFVMKIYGIMKCISLYCVEELLYVKEAQMDKFWKELVVANVAHANYQTSGIHDQNTNYHERCHMFRGRGVVKDAPCMILNLIVNYVENIGMM